MRSISWKTGIPSDPGKYFELVYENGVELHLPFVIFSDRPEWIGGTRTYCRAEDYYAHQLEADDLDQ